MRASLPALLLVGACARTLEPCAGPHACPAGHECLAQRCVIEGGVPVAPRLRRRLATPSAISLFAREVPRGLGPSATLGGGADPSATLYLRFERIYEAANVELSFLVLEPRAGARAGDDLRLEVWRARRAWDEPGFSRASAPGLAPPFVVGIARAELPVRIDVTELVRYLAEHPNHDHGLALRAQDSTPEGITLATGIAGGEPPYLEVYAR